jgi:hypothetical protein
LAARRGWASQTTTGISGSHLIDTVFEYLDESGTSTIITTANNKIYKNITDFTDAANDITSTTAPSDDHWQFINFNGKCLGFQRGEVPIARTSGDFADASYTGTGPDGNAAVAAFGRVWAADADLQTVRFSVLLDDTDYSLGNGGGTIDMSSIWTGGMDEIVALAAIGASLVVFGKNHIVIWADGTGSEIGLDPTNLEIVDTIEGTGCIARDSIARSGEGDLLFLSRHGIQSLGRVIEQKTNPVTTLSKHVRGDLATVIAQSRAADSELDRVRAVISPEEGFYIINFPTAGKQYVLDLAHAFQDADGEQVTPVTTWQLGGTVAGLCTTRAGSLYFGSTGVVGKYSGSDDNGSAYDFEFTTGWLDGGEMNHRLKMLKELLCSITIGDGTVVWTWEFDFNGTQLSRTAVYTGGGTSEFNIAEFNLDAFSGAVTIQRKILPAYGEGQFLKFGATASINGFDLVIQHISVSPKIGRMVS